MSDRLAVMADGLVEQVGPPEAVYSEPASAYVAGFLGSANVVDVEVRGTGRRRGRLPARAVHRCEARRRRRHPGPAKVVDPARAGAARTDRRRDPAGASSFPGLVDHVVYLGPTTHVVVRLSDGQTLLAAVPNSTGGTRSGTGPARRCAASCHPEADALLPADTRPAAPADAEDALRLPTEVRGLARYATAQAVTWRAGSSGARCRPAPARCRSRAAAGEPHRDRDGPVGVDDRVLERDLDRQAVEQRRPGDREVLDVGRPELPEACPSRTMPAIVLAPALVDLDPVLAPPRGAGRPAPRGRTTAPTSPGPRSSLCRTQVSRDQRLEPGRGRVQPGEHLARSRRRTGPRTSAAPR